MKKEAKVTNKIVVNSLIMDKDLPAYIAKMKAEGRKLAFINGDGTTTPID